MEKEKLNSYKKILNELIHLNKIEEVQFEIDKSFFKGENLIEAFIKTFKDILIYSFDSYRYEKQITVKYVSLNCIKSYTITFDSETEAKNASASLNHFVDTMIKENINGTITMIESLIRTKI